MLVTETEMEVTATEMEVTATEMEVTTTEMEVTATEMEVTAIVMEVTAAEMEVVMVMITMDMKMTEAVIGVKGMDMIKVMAMQIGEVVGMVIREAMVVEMRSLNIVGKITRINSTNYAIKQLSLGLQKNLKLGKTCVHS